jgi:FkbM family methyltransferase
MLIPLHIVDTILETYNVARKGILHVGAHNCEEMQAYNTLGFEANQIIWVDANPEKTSMNLARGIPNCYTAVLDETAGEKSFKITNNGQSSSLLDFGTHALSYKDIVVVETIKVQTERLSDFFTKTSLDPANYNIWNFDIQGSELHVFRGSPEILTHVDLIYTEVNTAEVYRGCGQLNELDDFLKIHGFKRVKTEITNDYWGDAIYVKNKIVDRV